MPTASTLPIAELAAPDDALEMQAAEGRAPRVLMLTHRTPFPPNKGDRIRSYHILNYLSKRAQVDLATLADEPVSRETELELHKLANRVEIVPVGRRMRWIRAIASVACGRSATEGLFASSELARRLHALAASKTYDLVVVVCSAMVQFLKKLPLGDAKVLVDLVDVDSQKWLDYAAQSSGWRRALYRLEGRRVRRLEIELADKRYQLAATTQVEVHCLHAFHPEANIAAISNGVDFEYFRPDDSHSHCPQSCVFVGALDYKPNVDAVKWFCAEVWPIIRENCPTAKLWIVGRHPLESVRRLGGASGVEVVADVADVRPYLWQAGVVVAPLQIARGVQNKVLEAMACGKPVVATPQALEGLAVTPGEHVCEVKAPDEWVDVLRQLMESDIERRRLGVAGRAFVCERHDWATCLSALGDLMGSSLPLARS